MTTSIETASAITQFRIDAATAIPVRFTAAQMRLLRSAVELVRVALGGHHGVAAAEAAILTQLWNLICHRVSRSRLHLNAIELAVAMLCMRVHRRYLRHGHLRGRKGAGFDEHRRLIRRLEVLRKRAKRRAILITGRASYDESARQWRTLAVRLRSASQCGCQHRISLGTRRVWNAIINDCVSIARTGLRARTSEQLPEPELRYAVRLALRHLRRGRANFGVATVLREREFGQEFLADFAERRLRRRR